MVPSSKKEKKIPNNFPIDSTIDSIDSWNSGNMADSCLGPSSTKPTTLSSQLSKYPWPCPPLSFSLLSPCNFSFTLKKSLLFSSYSSMSWSPNGPTIPNRFIAQNTHCSSYSSSPRNNQPSLLVFSGMILDFAFSPLPIWKNRQVSLLCYWDF